MAVVASTENTATPAVQKNHTAAFSLMNFMGNANGRRILLMIGIAATVAVMSGMVLWSQKPDYRVLFANFSDRDGGAIVAALQKANIPYQFAEGGGAILVPAEQVHEVRLRLAAEGLPKGGNVGFELMENQKLGISQFLEQVNFQRALEGELARSIQSVAAVQTARVHLAIPKPSVFVREQKKPTASILLNMHSGRTLDAQQVNAIIYLVASSVPELSPKNVTLVDQAGNLLSENNKPARANMLDPSQLKYVQELQQGIVKRIESILAPIVGQGNVRAEATADIDFSHSEQAAETYKPNQTPESAAVRSKQSSESSGGTGASGVPGALTNQPAPNATAPLGQTPLKNPDGSPMTPEQQAAARKAQAQSTPGTPSQRDSTTNYEVDKTVHYVQQPMGGIKRLSVAVVVNYKRSIDKEGKAHYQPLSEAEQTQINNLVKEAMGYNKDRGDTLNVVNSPFAGIDDPEPEPLPIWQRPEIIDLGISAGKYLGLALVLLVMYRKILSPMIKKLQPEPVAALPDETGEESHAEEEQVSMTRYTYQENLDAAKEMARRDPKMVANIVRSWIDNE